MVHPTASLRASTARSGPERVRGWTESSGTTKHGIGFGRPRRSRPSSQLVPETERAGAHRAEPSVSLTLGSPGRAPWVRPRHPTASAFTGRWRGLNSPSRCGFGRDTGSLGPRRTLGAKVGFLTRRSFGSRNASALPGREAPRGFGQWARAGRAAPRKDGQTPETRRPRFPVPVDVLEAPSATAGGHRELRSRFGDLLPMKSRSANGDSSPDDGRTDRTWVLRLPVMVPRRSGSSRFGGSRPGPS